MMKTINLSLYLPLLALLMPAMLHAHLEANPEQCQAIYGEAQFTQEHEGQVIRGYQSTLKGFGDAVVMAAFKSNQVVRIRYKTGDKSEFTAGQLAFIISLNGKALGRKFVDEGVSPDGTVQLWATDDKSAYMMVHIGKAMVDVMTRAEAIDALKELPAPAKSAPPASPR